MEINLTVCYTAPCFNLQFVYNFPEIESTFPVPFWNYVADYLCLCAMVSICLIRKGKYDLFLHKGLLLDWLFFLLYLLQSVFSSQYSAKTTNFSFLNLFISYIRLFQNISKFLLLECNLISLPFKDLHKGNFEDNFINFVMWPFACMV